MRKFLSSNIFFLFILFIICFAIYGKSINFGLTHLDDDILTAKNINYISDYRNIPGLFKTDCYYGSRSNYYRPMLGLSFSLETIFFKYNKKVYHTTNIILFVLALFVIFIFLKRVLYENGSRIGVRDDKDTGLPRAEALAMTGRKEWILKCLIILVAVHPVLASVPVWLPARNDSLLTIFIISSFIFFINYLNTKKISHLFLYLFFYTLSIFTKETALPMVIFFPMLAGCMDVWKYRGIETATANDRFPTESLGNDKIERQRIGRLDGVLNYSTIKLFNLIALAAIILFYFFMRNNSSVLKASFFSYFSNCWLYFENIIIGTMNYFRYIFFPNHIPIMLYDVSLDIFTIVLSLFILATLIFIFRKKIISGKILLFSTVFFFISIFATFLQQEYVLLFHRLILAVPAVLLILTILTERLILFYPATKKYLVLIFISLFTVFAYISFNQIDKYKNGLNFWHYAYTDASNYHDVYNGLGYEYMLLGKYEKAHIFFQKAVELKNDFDHNLNFAGCLIMQNKPDNAIEILLKLEKREKNLTVLRYLSQLYAVKGEKEKAEIYRKRMKKLQGNFLED